MPLGTRDLLLVLRARDEASRVVTGLSGTIEKFGLTSAAGMRQMGTALTSVGVGVTAVGLGLAKFFESSAKEFIKFDTAARLTHTQVRDVGISLEDIKNVALRVGREMPVPFEQLQPALYDIFSSVDLGLDGSEQALRLFAKAGAATGEDLRTVARSTFAVMNNLGLGADSLTDILDTQFRAVQLGIGDYGQLAQVIGRLTQGGVLAGQSVQTITGALAFLSRQTGDMNQAGTELRNVFTALTRPKVIEHLKDMGVNVVDNQGNFRDFGYSS